MDEFIYLESDEEITSVIDKLKQTEAHSVGLVVPKGATMIQSVVNLKILDKEARSLGKKIALVTSDAVGRALASQIGLTVYESPRAEKPSIEQPRPEISASEVVEIDLGEEKTTKPPSGVKVHHYEESDHTQTKQISVEKYQSPKTVALHQPRDFRKMIYLLIPLLLIFLGFYLFYPKVTITLGVQTEPFEQSLQIIVDNNINKNDEARLAIIGELQEAEKETSKEFSATGKKEIGQKATGTVTVYNEWDSEPHTYPSASKLTSGDKTFLSNISFTVPGGTLVSGKIQAGTVNVQITAEKAGEDYNLNPTTFTIEGAPTKISGRNAQALTGGLSRQVAVVSAEDINNAKNSLKDELSQQTKEDLGKKAKKQTIIEDSIENTIVSSSSDKGIDDEADKFKETVKIKSRTISFEGKNYQETIAESLTSSVPSDKELVPSTSSEFSITKIETDYDHGILKISGTVKTKLGPKIDKNALKKSLSGQDSQTATDYLLGISGVKNLEIKFRPSWWLKKVPSIKRNIEIIFNYQ